MDSQEQVQDDPREPENNQGLNAEDIARKLKDKVPDTKTASADAGSGEDEDAFAHKDDAEYSIPEHVIKNANAFFLMKTLSPEITKNEEKKREHKDALIKIVKWFLFFQFVVLALLFLGFIITVLVFHGLGNDFNLDYMNSIMKFIGVYITSVVAELIAMLHYIVSNVFDTSIAGLVSLYKNVSDEKDEEKENIDASKDV